MEFAYEESGDGFLVNLSYRRQKVVSTSVPREGINEGINLLLEHIWSALHNGDREHSFRTDREHHSGNQVKVFTINPESRSLSSRNGVHDHPGIAFTMRPEMVFTMVWNTRH